MVAYSFQRQFADPILMGRKRHTVRAPRKRHARPGEALQLYTGMRTTSCRLIARATCEAVEPIRIEFHDDVERYADTIDISGKIIKGDALTEFAQSDGFAGWLEMRSFWLQNHGLMVFDGVIIRWRDMVPG